MKNVILVLGSGGARGIAHISVIRELEKRGYRIKEIVGTSMGAFVGGMHAAGKLESFAERILNMSKVDFLRVVDPALSRSGVVKGEKIFEIVSEEITADCKIEDLSIPFSAISVDVNRNEIFQMKNGSLFTAIRSSISIPNFFTPVEHEGKRLVDGGVLCPLPLNFVSKKSQDDIVIAVNLSGPAPIVNQKIDEKKDKVESKENRLRTFFSNLRPDLSFNYLELMIQSLELMQMEIARLTLALHQPDIVINVPYSTCQMLQFFRAKEVLELGDKLICEALDQYESNT